jgi:hypothetical protein
VAFTTHPPSSAKFKERVELYLYSISGPSWPELPIVMMIYSRIFMMVQIHVSRNVHKLWLRNSWKVAAWKLEQEMRIMEQIFKEVMFEDVN